MAVLRRPDRLGELEVAEVHPGFSLDQVQAATGWPIRVATTVTETLRPTIEEVRLLREEIDLSRLYLR